MLWTSNSSHPKAVCPGPGISHFPNTQHWHLMGLEIQFARNIVSVSTITLKNLFPFKSKDIPNKAKVTGTNKNRKAEV